MVMSAFGEGGGVSLHLPCDWLQMISETRRTSVETHFMSTVRADNFCPMDHLQCFESEFAVHKSFLHLLSLSLFSPLCFSRTPTLR